MIDHLSTYATDYAATKRFYDAVMPALGHRCVMELTASWNPEWPTQRMCAYGPGDKPIYWIIEARASSTPRHIAFAAQSRAEVDAFHRRGLETGAEDHGAPGVRAHYHPAYYGGFLLDPDGNNVEAVCHTPG
ncbi:VOC family protein [Sandaracinus amylolyticus]|uniref:VOC family protein n=1 Tax=Sandaracinus amylolyticus TaxID=927083 RepID=UPI001F1EE8B4|nr:VOC family protein [Sandaracinus amylolyticus]UJR81696.1 putative lactoylglutathione lyase [Sandaracinus amylolyticus]